MHDCKVTSEQLVDLIYRETGAGGKLQIEAIVGQCATCLREYEELRDLVVSIDQTLAASEPAANFWRGYETRLRLRVEASNQRESALLTKQRPLARLLSASIRIPAPIAATLLLLLGATSYFALKPQPVLESNTRSPLVEIRTVEKPIVQEKVVTRVVYRDRKRPPREKVNRSTLNSPGASTLAGFRPTNEVKFTVVKGERVDEK